MPRKVEISPLDEPESILEDWLGKKIEGALFDPDEEEGMTLTLSLDDGKMWILTFTEDRRMIVEVCEGIH